MAAKPRYFTGGPGRVLKDKDWLTIIGALLHDKPPESQQLATRLLTKTKQGRHVRLLRTLMRHQPRLRDMQRLMKVSRRTVFRDLNDLGGYGILLSLDMESHYAVERLPQHLKRLL